MNMQAEHKVNSFNCCTCILCNIARYGMCSACIFMKGCVLTIKSLFQTFRIILSIIRRKQPKLCCSFGFQKRWYTGNIFKPKTTHLCWLKSQFLWYWLRIYCAKTCSLYVKYVQILWQITTLYFGEKDFRPVNLSKKW